MQTFEADGQISMFSQDSCAGKTSPEPFPAESQRERISGSSSKKSWASSAVVYQFLDLTPGNGNLLGESYWEDRSPWLGGSSTLNTGESPKDAVESSLSQILQPDPPSRYYLSRKACLGILRRAAERAKELQTELREALMMQSGRIPLRKILKEPIAFAANQRDEVRDLRDVAGTVGAQPGMKQQTFIAERKPACAGFCAGASPSAGGIGYTEEGSPTLKASESGTNMVPAVLCLNDQGGERLELAEDRAGTLRAQEHGHQPLILATQQGGAEIGEGVCPTITAAAGMSGNNQPVLFENHGIDCRYSGPSEVAPTMTARYGTGGNNTPLIGQEADAYCITGNAIDRQPQNGGNGIGYQPDLAYTLTATDHHAVFSRKRIDRFREDIVASAESARQGKDATDVVLQKKADEREQMPRLIRRLTPLECERLQGFPDGWTDIPGASDSARYKALGNSVAIPCVEYLMRGMALALRSVLGIK